MRSRDRDLHALHEGDGVSLQHDASQLLALVALHVHLGMSAKDVTDNTASKYENSEDILLMNRKGDYSGDSETESE